jgi:predicted PurR-regulated permease PerM
MTQEREIAANGHQSPAGSDLGEAPVPRAGTRRGRLLHAATSRHIPLQTIIVTIGLVVTTCLLAMLLYILRDVVMLVLVAGFVALVLNPPVVALQNWKLRQRGLAVAIVTFWALLVFFGLVVAFGRPLVDGLTHLANSLPGDLTKAEHDQGWIGHIIRRYHLEAWVRTNSPKLVDLAGNLGKPALALGKGALSAFVALGTIFILVVLLLLEGPKLRSAVLQLLSPERSIRYQRLGGEVSRSVSGYILGDVLTSVIAGLVVLITLAALQVPYALLWALWVALVDFVPTVGGALAGIPTVLFALAQSLTAGAVTAVVFLIYTQVENHVLNPVIMSRTVKVSPLLVVLSVLVAADLGNWVGGAFAAFAAALVAVPFAGVAQIVVRELWGPSSTAQPERESP